MTGSALLAAFLAAAAAAALVGSPETREARHRLGIRPATRRPPRPARRLLVLAGAFVAVAVGVVQGSLAVALALVVGSFGLGLAALRGRTRARLAAGERRAAVLDICDQMAAELRAGQPPGRALQHAAEAWSDLTPAASAFVLGGDVAAALRSAGQAPGADALLAVAAAWEVAQRSGAGLASVLDRTAEALRAEDATRREVTAALAPPRATARLLALLPVFGLLLGAGVGADPWGFLTGTPIGVACLAVGGGLGLAGLAWVERLAAAAEGMP